MAEYEKKVRQVLMDNGCVFKRHGKGGHDVWYSGISDHTFPVAVKIKSRHMANGILKEAGIAAKF